MLVGGVFWMEVQAAGWSSHRIYVNPSLTSDQGRRMNFQDCKGKAKANQVRQLLAAIENLPNDE